jgi:hypothetical protein
MGGADIVVYVGDALLILATCLLPSSGRVGAYMEIDACATHGWARFRKKAESNHLDSVAPGRSARG